jgi:two-component system sensor histidine kinase CpxA
MFNFIRGNKLFIKIYLWFWLTTILMMVAIVAVDRITDTGPVIEHLRHITGQSLLYHGNKAVNILDKDGVSSFSVYLKNIEDTLGLRIFFFDSTGKEIRGQKAPQKLIDIASSLGNSGCGDLSSLSERHLVVRCVTGDQKRKFIIATEIPFRMSFPTLNKPPEFGPPPPLPPPPIFSSSEQQSRIVPPPLSELSSSQLSLPPPIPPHGSAFRSPSFILLRLIILLILSGLICYFLARYLTAPIKKLKNATRQFSEGDFSIRVVPKMGKRNDEISSLAFDFDLMAGKIQKLLTSQQTLLRDVSHELRSPLTRLNLAVELCRQRSDSELERCLDHISHESEKMDELIGHILALSRLESGIQELKKEKINLGSLIEEIRIDASFEASILNRSVKIIINDKAIMEGSTELIRRAIENVVRNAILYTPEGSVVEICLNSVLKNDVNYALITVHDHGKGVPEEDIENIFKPFYRTGEKEDRKTRGAGIGLAIAKTAIHLHGGTIRAFNSSDAGLSVEISLPSLTGL